MSSGRKRRLSTAVPLLYPMFVIPVETLLNLRKEHSVMCHQKLRDAGLLIQWEPHTGMGPVAFISHQWIAWDHADPDFEQLPALQRIIQRIREGEITNIDIDWMTDHSFNDREVMLPLEEKDLKEWVNNGYVWFDYFSVPQTVGYDPQANDALMNAVNSIPAYVECCQHFIVLCPPLEHKHNHDGAYNACNDFASWSTRGWCRAEACARLLARNTGPMIKIDAAEGTPILMRPMQTSHFAAGHGSFTCCERRHLFPQRDPATGVETMVKVACDKVKVASIMHLLIDKKVDTLRERLERLGAGEEAERRAVLFELRLVQGRRSMMLRGLESEADRAAAASSAAQTDSEQAYAEFMCAYRFDAAHVDGDAEDRRSGWTPLRYATYCNNLLAAQELLRRGADCEAPTARDHMQLALLKGDTVLHSAAQFGSAEMVGLLMDCGADAWARQKLGFTALDCACFPQNVAVVRVLLQRQPELLAHCNGIGFSPLHMFLCNTAGPQSLECIQDLLRSCDGVGERDTSGLGDNALMAVCSSQVGQPSVLQALLNDAGVRVGVDARMRWSDMSIGMLAITAIAHALHALNGWLGRRSSPMVRFYASLASGKTALMSAATNGGLLNIRTLLDAGADPTLRDGKRRTARDLAMLHGPFPLLQRVLEQAEAEWVARHSK